MFTFHLYSYISPFIMYCLRHLVDGPSHPDKVGRTVAGCVSCRHGHRIGEVTNSCARWTLVTSLLQGRWRGSSEDGLPGCPTRRAMEAQTARELLHPHDLGQGRVVTKAAGLTQHWTKPLAGKAAHLSRDSLSVTIRFMLFNLFFWMPGQLFDKQVCHRRRTGECERLGVPPSLTTSSESVYVSCPHYLCHLLSRLYHFPLFVHKRS